MPPLWRHASPSSISGLLLYILSFVKKRFIENTAREENWFSSSDPFSFELLGDIDYRLIEEQEFLASPNATGNASANAAVDRAEAIEDDNVKRNGNRNNANYNNHNDDRQALLNSTEYQEEEQHNNNNNNNNNEVEQEEQRDEDEEDNIDINQEEEEEEDTDDEIDDDGDTAFGARDALAVAALHGARRSPMIGRPDKKRNPFFNFNSNE